MHALRTSPILARLVLAWFALVLSVAGASSMVHPATMELVCTADGTRIVMTGDDGQPAGTDQHALDCSLCLAATPPPDPAPLSLEMPHPLARGLKPAVAAHIAALVGAPLPARGPPFFA